MGELLLLVGHVQDAVTLCVLVAVQKRPAAAGPARGLSLALSARAHEKELGKAGLDLLFIFCTGAA
jgi:hypothetical protein